MARLVKPKTLEDRLDVYRALARRDVAVPELERLVDLLESELRARDTRRKPADLPPPR